MNVSPFQGAVETLKRTLRNDMQGTGFKSIPFSHRYPSSPESSPDNGSRKRFGVTHFLSETMEKKITQILHAQLIQLLKALTWPRQKQWPILGDAVKASKSCQDYTPEN